MAKYQHAPLSGARHIRLLKLCAGAKADKLSVDLIHTPLDEAPSFTALSYVWGDPQPQTMINCSGRQAEIGPSLHSALRHLQQPDSETFVWADALCINQNDILERSQQVRMMGDIYAAAHSTAIWLGEESGELKLAFDCLHSFAEVWDLSESDQLLLEDDSGLITRNWGEMMLQVAFGGYQDAAFRHIWALLNRPWFTRKWIIQELVKSQRPLMVAGRETLPWAVLACWMNFLDFYPPAKEHFTILCPQPLEAGTKTLGMNMLRATLLTRTAAFGNQILLYLVASTLVFRCSDPRDHIFALAGIASDADRFDLVDYGSSTEEVCRQLAYACVSDSMSLKLLWSLVFFTPLKHRLRSWVPNLESVLADGDGSILALLFTVQHVRDYNASGDSVLQAQLGDGGKMLTIRGRILDRLQLLGSDKRSLADSHSIKTMMDGNGHFVVDNLRRAIGQQNQWLEECMAIAKGEEAFRDTLLYDNLIIKQLPQDLEVVRSGFSTQTRLHKTLTDECDPGRWRSVCREWYSLESTPLLGNMFSERLCRRFGRTGNGRIGWLPPVAKEGDFICVFDGMELPYAIRPAAGGRYLLVGECIIPGLMMGEGMEIPGVSSEIIVLE